MDGRFEYIVYQMAQVAEHEWSDDSGKNEDIEDIA